MSISMQVTALNVRRAFLAEAMKQARKNACNLLEQAKDARDRARWAKEQIRQVDDELREALDARCQQDEGRIPG